MLKKLFSIFLLSIAFSSAFAQLPKTENLPRYDMESLHFGFGIGINKTNFVVYHQPNFYLFDSLKSVNAQGSTGFNLCIVSELSLTKYLKLRFVPDLSFAQREIQYYFEAKTDTITRTKKVESTFIDFPLLLKLKSARANNFGAYMIAGGKYTLDLASQKPTGEFVEPGKEFLKLRKHDIGYEVGAGLDFYLPFVKMSLEGKLSVGTKNVLYDEDNIYTDSIRKLRSRVFIVTLTFEGG